MLALKQVIRPALTEWTADQVAEWVPSVGYEMCSNIIRFAKVSGEILLQNLNNDYLRDTMGIIGEVEGFKFISEVNKVKDSKVVDVALFGWGTNFMG